MEKKVGRRGRKVGRGWLISKATGGAGFDECREVQL